MKNFNFSPDYINILPQSHTTSNNKSALDLNKLLQTIKDLNIGSLFNNKNTTKNPPPQNETTYFSSVSTQSFMQQENFKLAQSKVDLHNSTIKKLRKQ